MSVGSGIFFASMSWILQMIGMNIHDWVQGERDTGQKYKKGLWRECHEKDPCTTFASTDLKAWLRVCQAFAILAAIAMAGAAIAGAVVCFKGKSRRFAIAALVLALLGGIISLICLLVYASNVAHIALSYGIGYKLCAVASCFSLAACGFYSRISREDDDSASQ